MNEIWHDVEATAHDSLFDLPEAKVALWKKIGRHYISNNTENIKLLDLGSGSGFVPLQIAEFVKEGDLFICSDISQNILNECKKKVSDKKFKCDFKYLKLNGKTVPLESNMFDYITLNGVLHHVPDLLAFFKEINRLLKVNGRLIIGGEPNRAFVTHPFLFNNYRFFSMFFVPQQLFLAILRKLKLVQFALKKFQRFSQTIGTYNRITEEVNKQLQREGIVNHPLSTDELIEIIDIHSPTAGGYHKERGIDIFKILKLHLQNFEVEYYETHEHLYRASYVNKFTVWFDSFLKRNFPESGAIFFIVLKKVASQS